MTPLVSVVIPSANRPHCLPRAIESALAGMDRKDIEVIVIPNGPDESWRRSLMPYKDNPSVKIVSIKQANSNAARNIGMSAARGKFIRFLDDDDILYSEGSRKQYETIFRSGADICSAMVDLLDHDGNIFGVWRQPETIDFVSGALSAKRMLQVTAHVFRLESIRNIRWNVDLKYSQDIDWMLRLCSEKDLSWVKCDTNAGGWSKHINKRISTQAPLHLRKKIVSIAIIRLVKILEQQKRLSEERLKSATAGLWECVHAAFFMHPLYWTRIALRARNMEPNSHPELDFYDKQIIKKINLHPLLWEWFLTPKRLINYSIRRTLLVSGLTNKW